MKCKTPRILLSLIILSSWTLSGCFSGSDANQPRSESGTPTGPANQDTSKNGDLANKVSPAQAGSDKDGSKKDKANPEIGNSQPNRSDPTAREDVKKPAQPKTSEKGSSSVFKEEPIDSPISQTKWRMTQFPKKEIQTDLEVGEYLGKHKVTVSLTTSPSRISKVYHVLDTLDWSDLTQVFLNLPRKFGRDGSVYGFPFETSAVFKKRYGNQISYLRQLKDLGPITKLLYSVEHLQKKGDPDAILIIVDDDTAYPAGMVSEMIDSLVHYPNTVVAGSANDIEFWKIDERQIPKTPQNLGGTCDYSERAYCDVVEGFGSVGFRVSSVDVDLMKKLADSRFSKECFNSDDLVISFSLALSGVNRMKVRTPFLGTHLIEQYDYGFEADALHRGAGLESEDPQNFPQNVPTNINDEKYQKCHAKLMELCFDPKTQSFKDVQRIKADWDRDYNR